MSNETKKQFSITKIITLISVLSGITLAGWAFEDRYAKTDSVETIVKNINLARATELKLVEAESVKTFEGIQMQQEMMQKTLQIEMYQIQKEYLDREYDGLRREKRLYPNDPDVNERFDDVKSRRKQVQEKIDKKMMEK